MLRDLFQWLADSFLAPSRPVEQIRAAPSRAVTIQRRENSKLADVLMRRTDPQILAWRDFVVRLINGRVPAGFTHEGNLSLAKLRVRELPVDFTVKGNLDLRQCQRLAVIGDGLDVRGDLQIGGRCPEPVWYEDQTSRLRPTQCVPELSHFSRDPQVPLNELPIRLRVAGNLILRRCVNVRGLPDWFTVGKDLVIEGCPRFKSLPEGFTRPGGGLTIKGCPQFSQLPARLVVAGDLRLIGLPITELPFDLQVGGSLVIECCPRLKSLPEVLSIGADLVVRQTPVETLPQKVTIGRHLVVSRCLEFRSLPSTIDVGGDVSIQCCAKLTEFPPDLPLRKSLKLRDCLGLTGLPAGLVVPRTLNLKGCANLERLAARTRIGLGKNRTPWNAALVLSGCRSLRALPDDLEVGGSIDLAETAITAFPRGLSKTPILWNGVAIRPEAVFHPETLTAAQILSEPNAEIRRVTLERAGIENVLRNANARVVDQDTDAGGERRLLDIAVNFRGRRPWRYLHCRCPSTGRQYLLRVPFTLTTCHAAAAWLAGFDRPEEYRPELET